MEEYVLDMLRDQLNRRQPIDNVSRNLLRLLTSTCGYKEVRLMAVQKLEMWLQNPKVRAMHGGGQAPGSCGAARPWAAGLTGSFWPLQLTRPAQDLLTSVCMNCSTHSTEDMDVISHLIKIRLKPKVLLSHYMLCIRCGRAGCGGVWRRAGGRGRGPARASALSAWPRELLNAHKDNLGTTIKFVIFNELSNARNPNNMQILYTVLQHSSELAPKVGAARPAAWQACGRHAVALGAPGCTCARGLESGPCFWGLASSLGPHTGLGLEGSA